MQTMQTDAKQDERLPWTNPQVFMLTVNLDTRSGTGSQADCVNPSALLNETICP